MFNNVLSEDVEANAYDGVSSGGYGMMTYGNSGGHLFLWITLTMMWVAMILSIMALVKYITREDKFPAKRKK